MKRTSAVLFTILPLFCFAQNTIEQIVGSVRHDAGLIFDAFLTPGAESVMQASQGGWYYTAKPLEAYAFDFSVVGTLGFSPKDSRSFRVSDLDFINDVTAVPDVIPTVLGDGEQATVTVRSNFLNLEYDFEMINGLREDLPFSSTPAGAIQAAIGLPYGSEVAVRFTPKVTVRDVSGSSYGIGLKHSLSQYFLEEGSQSPFEVSLFANYSRYKFTYDFMDKSPFEGENQHIETISRGYSAQVLGSLDYGHFSFFGSAGFVGSSSTLAVLGSYRYPVEVENVGVIQVEFQDLLTLDYNPSAFRAALGATVHFWDFHLFSEITFQEYGTLSAGLIYTLPKQ